MFVRKLSSVQFLTHCTVIMSLKNLLELTGRTLGINNKFSRKAVTGDPCHAYTKSLLRWGIWWPSVLCWDLSRNWLHLLLSTIEHPNPAYTILKGLMKTCKLPLVIFPKRIQSSSFTQNSCTAPTSQYTKTAQICSHLVILNHGGKQYFTPYHSHPILIQ